MTPMEAMFNRPIKVPLDIFYKAVDLKEEEARKIKELDLSLEVGGYAYKVRDELQDMYRLIAKNRDVRMNKCELLHDRKRGRNARIRKKWKGPWEIELIYNDVNYALKSFHTRRVLLKTVHQCMLKKWHGPAAQHAKFKTTHHRERESKSGKVVMNTQDSNVNTQQSQINVSPPLEKLPREKGVKRLAKEARMLAQATTSDQQQETTNKVTRFGRRVKATDHYQA